MIVKGKYLSVYADKTKHKMPQPLNTNWAGMQNVLQKIKYITEAQKVYKLEKGLQKRKDYA